MEAPHNGVVIYKSRSGSTKQYGEWIRNNLRVPMIDPDRLDHQILSMCDFLVIGTPVYNGNMLISDWLRQNEHRLRGTRLFFFIVCTYYADLEKQQIMIRDNIPSGLLPSCAIWFLPGRDPEVESIAALTADLVQEKVLVPLLGTVRAFAAGVGIV